MWQDVGTADFASQQNPTVFVRHQADAATDKRGTVIKQDIVNEVVQRTGLPKAKAEQAVESIFEKMKQALEQGERIELRGFGVFQVRPRKTGIGRNPRTGRQVTIPPGRAVRFKPGKELQTIE